ncbi:hypothetical protein [Saccharomonospora cyanea]|uniref:MalT-like TPR region domain-containing protein n=1 Tax=Saccharomonospora cyanea NA-134 TaxID=882082 RepID=H5XH20_9PSEU|nr:hypothetical protein [Saccharomonospora cyanea]EHR59491.1 hypothetical protein SaccyDRAFT_0563 [Saccharomonospora cyanea NA-134]
MPIVEKVLRTAAFGGSRDAEQPMPDGVTVASAPLRSWLQGVVFGACGRYAAAASLLEPLSRHRDALVASLAASALASHRRQLGGHAAALRLDGMALRRAAEAEPPGGSGWRCDDPDGLDAAGALVDALLGLAADHLGLGRLAASGALVARAAQVVAVSGCWRAETRLGWVRAELALASGRPADGVLPAKRALAIAERRGAHRHAAKSALVLGAALAAVGEREGVERARALVESALAAAERNGWRSLTWPALALLADLEPEQAVWNRSRVTDELSVLLDSTDPVGRRLAHDSPWVPI